MKMLCIKDYEDFAKKHLDRQAWNFFSQGAERELTLEENMRSFSRYRLIPRMLRDVRDRDLSVTVLGERISLPIGLAPTAYQKLAHPEGEIAASKAASDAGTIYTLSTVSTTSLEEVSQCLPNQTPLWMQIYVVGNGHHTLKYIRKIEASGYKALVVTVDTPETGLQLRMWRNGLKLPPHMRSENVDDILKEIDERFDTTVLTKRDKFFAKLTWEDIDWMKSVTKLPIILKGILTAADAVLAVKHGAAAVWVSNHGGRQLDGVLPTLEALPEIARALDGSGCEVYVDGGVRWGSDVLKALALGAKVVFIGRPIVWGLSHSGSDGVRSVIEILRNELIRAMNLAGCKDIKDIGPHLIKNRCHCNL